MRNARSSAGRALCVALVALGLGAVALACEANLETTCYDGPCVVPQATTTTGPGGGGGGGSGGTGGGDVCSEAPAEGDFPCDVFDVLKAKCHTCHNQDHLKGAPIDLHDCARFHEKDCTDSQTRFRVAQAYVSADQMPAPAGVPLTVEEKKTLLDWLDGCSLCVPAGTGCTDTQGPKLCYE